MCVIVVDKWAEIKGERKGGGKEGGIRERERERKSCHFVVGKLLL